MLDLITLLLVPVVAVVTTLTAFEIYRCFVTTPAVVSVAALPTGLAMMLASFGALNLLGAAAPLFLRLGLAIAVSGAVALVYVTWRLDGRARSPRHPSLQ
jgi:hypothetical protein